MRSLWTNRRYVAWLISDTSKGLATGLFSFTIPLIALLVTNDPAQAGIIGGVGMVVRLVVLLYGGVLADRHDRIALMLLGAGVASILSFGFTLLALGDALTFATLLIVEVLLVARAGVFEPASESALKEIVPAESMGRAQAANQARDAILQLGGGPLGGALLVVGAWLVGVVMTAAYAFSAPRPGCCAGYRCHPPTLMRHAPMTHPSPMLPIRMHPRQRPRATPCANCVRVSPSCSLAPTSVGCCGSSRSSTWASTPRPRP